jgi:beta-aspartyl-peptidase (threonine type)
LRGPPAQPARCRLIPQIVVHGGAWDIPPGLHEAHLAGCARAARLGYELLARGGAALDAVERAVLSLEADATFDAGVGAFLNRDGDVELDAAIMEGTTLRAGAVAAVRTVKHPIALARRLLEEGSPVLVVGAGADLYARERGLPTCDPAELRSEEALRRHRGASDPAAPRSIFGDTVGAVAVDQGGRVAAANSTGGTPGKRPGRVGDTPVPGCGLYAWDPAGAAACTGRGEEIVRVTLARQAVFFLEAGLEPAAAAERAVALLGERGGGRGGIIVIDRHGRAGWAHNTPCLARARMGPDLDEPEAGITAAR